jgi:hypothetical protein
MAARKRGTQVVRLALRLSVQVEISQSSLVGVLDRLKGSPLNRHQVACIVRSVTQVAVPLLDLVGAYFGTI